MQKCFTYSAQTLETKINSNINRINVEKTNLLTTLLKDY
jgi:hypothetical protein